MKREKYLELTERYAVLVVKQRHAYIQEQLEKLGATEDNIHQFVIAPVNIPAVPSDPVTGEAPPYLITERIAVTRNGVLQGHISTLSSMPNADDYSVNMAWKGV